MRYGRAAWLIIGGLMFVLASCSTQQATHEDTGAFVAEYEKKIEYVERRLAEERWKYYTRGHSDSLAFYRELCGDLHADPDRVGDIKSSLALIDDAAVRRRLELIYRNFLRGAVRADPAVDRLVDSLLMIHRAGRIVFDGSTTTTEQLREVIRSDDDAGRRRKAYAVLTSPNASLINGLASLARIRNQVAARFGYNSFYDLMLIADGLDKSDLDDILRRLDDWSRDAYKLMLDSLKASLGIADAGVWDIEHDLYAAEYAAAGYVPSRGQMALAGATAAGLGITLGAMPVYFAERDSSVRESIDKALPVHIPDDIRVPTLLTDGLSSARRLFHQVGEAMYLSHIEQNTAILARAPAPCFRYGMADMFAEFVSQETWMRKYAAMPEPVVMRVSASRKLLQLYRLRTMLVDIMFERQLYANPSSDLAAVYRGLFQKYMMMPADEGSAPIDLIMDYMTAPVERQNELIGECIRAHVYRYLTDRYGSVLDNQHTREFLVHNFFRFGALDDWKTLLQRGTGEPLDVSCLIINSDN